MENRGTLTVLSIRARVVSGIELTTSAGKLASLQAYGRYMHMTRFHSLIRPARLLLQLQSEQWLDPP